MSLSIIILSKNSQQEIVPTLKTCRFANEVILIDTGSEDDTLKIARPFVDKIIRVTGGVDFSKWRNKGAKHASSEWILYVDSDERVPPTLAAEIIQTLNHPQHPAYRLHRYEILLGKHLRHWGDSYVLRLFRKDALKGYHGRLHEQPQVEGRIGTLKHSLIHLTHKNLEEKLLNTLDWSLLEAQLLLKSNHPPMRPWRFWRILLTSFWHFFKKGLWLDGTEGHLELIYQTFSRFLTYFRLWELQRQPSLSETYRQIDQKILADLKQDKN